MQRNVPKSPVERIQDRLGVGIGADSVSAVSERRANREQNMKSPAKFGVLLPPWSHQALPVPPLWYDQGKHGT